MGRINPHFAEVPSGSKRRYRSQVRSDRAAATRASVLAAARTEFAEHGYAKTTVAAIAGRAGVAVDTVYSSVGRKPELLREIVETAISGTAHAVPAEERDYVRRLRAAPTATEKIEIYAAAVAELHPRMAEVFRMLRGAVPSAPESIRIWQEISERRAGNMRLFVADLRAAGGLRADLGDDAIADLIWLLAGTEAWVLLVDERGWAPDDYGDRLADLLKRVLLWPADGDIRGFAGDTL